MEQIAPQIYRWTVPHPEWRSSVEEVVSYALVDGEALALVDPLLPSQDDARRAPLLADIDEMIGEARRLELLVTIPYHTRSAETFYERYSRTVPTLIWGHSGVKKRLTRLAPLEVIPQSATGEAAEIADGAVLAYTIGKPRRSEYPLYFPGLRADHGVTEDEGAQTREVQRVLAAPRLADRVGQNGAVGDLRRLAGGALRDHLEWREAGEPLLDAGVPPDERRHGAGVALVERLGAACVVGDGDEQFEAPGLADHFVDVGEQRRPPGVILGRQQRIDEGQRLAVHERVAHDLLDAGPPLRVRRRPAVDLRRDLLHPVLLARQPLGYVKRRRVGPRTLLIRARWVLTVRHHQETSRCLAAVPPRRSVMPVSPVFLQGPFKVDFKKAWLPAAERRAAGAEARSRVSRRALGVWEPADEARGPVDVVMAVAASRQARLVPLRSARMAVSPFTFFRGAAQRDQSCLPRRRNG